MTKYNNYNTKGFINISNHLEINDLFENALNGKLELKFLEETQ